MTILLYGINYSPELTGIGKYTGEMGAWLAQQGHKVEVITTMPYYPEWKVHRDYSGRVWFTEEIEGVVVHRCPFYVPTKVTGVTRILHETSFVASSLVFWLQKSIRRYDAVISICPPFHLGFLPLLFSKIKSVPLLYHIQDLQVDAAKDLGIIKNERFLNILFGLEKFLLRRSTAVSSISEGMLQRIVAKGIPSAKTLFFPNWVDTDFIQPLPIEKSLKAELGFESEDRVMLYSGNLGEKQGLENIIEVAYLLQHIPNLHFAIVGEGGIKDKLVALAKAQNLTHVHFFPLQPYEKLSALLAMADVHLILQKKAASDLVMPSKLTTILAAGGCPLVTADQGTTLYDVVQKYNLGFTVEPENATALAEQIQVALQKDLATYRNNARCYAEQFLNKEAILKKFEANLQALCCS